MVCASERIVKIGQADVAVQHTLAIERNQRRPNSQRCAFNFHPNLFHSTHHLAIKNIKFALDQAFAISIIQQICHRAHQLQASLKSKPTRTFTSLQLIVGRVLSLVCFPSDYSTFNDLTLTSSEAHNTTTTFMEQ